MEDLTVGPLIQFKLLQLSPQKSVLLLKMHHIIYDGWSFGILIRELEVLTGGQEVIICLDTLCDWQEDSFERAIIAAASLYFYAYRRTLLTPNSRKFLALLTKLSR